MKNEKKKLLTASFLSGPIYLAQLHPSQTAPLQSVHYSVTESQNNPGWIVLHKHALLLCFRFMAGLDNKVGPGPV